MNSPKEQFQLRNFLSVIRQRDIAMNALRDIRDGKDNPSHLARQVVGESQCRVIGGGV